jgi:hypothetical protein
MPKNAALLLAFLLSFSIPLRAADLSAIHASALPQETAVLAALDDAMQLEPYSRSFTPDALWKFSLTKEDVVARLGKDLGFLTLAARNHPENGELQLLTGLVARYAYNVDVDNSFDTAMRMYDRAEKLAPADLRAPWFRAMLQCQTMHPDAGAKQFLSIEAGQAWDRFPAAFWDDYLECAAITNMPAHALRAASYIEKLHGPESEGRASLVDAEKKRFEAYDAAKKYEPKDVWAGQNTDADTVFTSTLCGVRMRVHGDWEANQMVLSNGTCVAYFSTGSYKAVTRNLRPSVLMMARQPKEDESLLDFAKKFMTGGMFLPDPALKCPAQDCIAMKGYQQGMYKADGDGHGRLVIFEREQPEFPGLIFESPQGVPQPAAGSGPAFYRPNQLQQRMPGKLYYLVLLDTAASIEEPALKDFDFFLQNLTVE